MEITVADYDPRWPEVFTTLAARVRQTFPPGRLVAVEHVGSTSVPGLAAKPIIDMSVVIPTAADLPATITHLATLGYVHEGDLGIPGRDAFRQPPQTPPHHLYVCPQDSPALREHIAFRDYLRAHPDAVRRYETLKRELAIRFRDDRPAYSEGKTEFVRSILAKALL